MKTHIILIAAFAALTMSALCAETTAPADMQAAIQTAESNAAKAIATGNLKDAQGWAEVSLQLRAGQYIAPLGELTGAFREQVKNIPAFIMTAVEVEAASPVTETLQNPYATGAVLAFMQNNPAAMRTSMAKEKLWRALFNDVDYDQKNKLDIAKLSAARQWIDQGCKAEISTPELAFLIPLEASPGFQATLQGLQPLLGQHTAAK